MTTSIEEIVAPALTSGAGLLLVISERRDDAPLSCSKVSARPVTIRGAARWQFTNHFADRVTHENCDPAAATQRVLELLSSSFRRANLFTTQADYVIQILRDGSFRLRQSPPSRAASTDNHNRTKAYVIPAGVPCPFLVEIGIMTPDGQVRRAMYHKFRQINRFLELVDDMVPALPREGTLHVVDFGCGKSYLTFALHHLLTAVHGREVQLTGLDRKADVIADCARLAERLHCRGLQFREGDLARYAAPGRVDLAVSLHACDTATDLALARAVGWQTSVILAVPCCQHELARQIRMADLAPILRHGILHERFSALATDAARALLLELHGYATQVVEFIDLEHTAKNILLRAVRRTKSEQTSVGTRDAEWQAFKRALGIESFALELALAGSTGQGATRPAVAE